MRTESDNEIYITRCKIVKDVCDMYKAQSLRRPGRHRMHKLTGIPLKACEGILRDLTVDGEIEYRENGDSRCEELNVEAETEEEEELEPVFPENLSAEDIGYPSVRDDDQSKDEQIRRLKAELREVKSQSSYLTRMKPDASLKGGTFTLTASDFHYFDRGFLLESYKSLVEKTIRLIEIYEPRKLSVIVNGDIVTGSGIFRNQNMENLLSTTEEQVTGAIFKMIEWDTEMKARLPKVKEIEYITLTGNHDYNRGEPLSQYFVWGCREFGMNMRFVGNEWIANLADDEDSFYNILVEHGYGNSGFGPSSNKLITETLRKIIGFHDRGYYGEKKIRRFNHGHTHWAQVGIRHAEGLYFDTTGGLHRNDRVNIGANSRPTGWISYISPQGSDDIIDPPILITPSDKAVRTDMDDPELLNLNRLEAARCQIGFADVAQERGIMEHVKKRIAGGE